MLKLSAELQLRDSCMSAADLRLICCNGLVVIVTASLSHALDMVRSENMVSNIGE
jgi:hypothetical protein